MVDRPDPATLTVDELTAALVELQHEYPTSTVAATADSQKRELLRRAGAEVVEPPAIPADVVAWWRAADARRRRLIEAIRGPLYVSQKVEPMELRRERLRKPGPPRLATSAPVSPTGDRGLAKYRSRTGMHFVIDTNTVDDETSAMEELRQLHADGWLNLTRTDTMDVELAGASDPAKRDDLLADSAEYVEHLGPMVLDHSRLDYSVLGSNQDEARLASVFGILFPGADRATTRKQNVRDAMHIATAIRYGANAFITNDTNTLDHDAAIREAFNGFGVYSPQQAIVTARRLVARSRHVDQLRAEQRGEQPPESP